jgi:hypothetical protein
LIDSDGLPVLPGPPELPEQSQLVNLSTRGFVGTGDSILIAGFSIRGTDSVRLLSRSVGPILSDFQITNTLADPMMSVRRQDGVEIASNDDWSDILSIPELEEFEYDTGAFSISTSSKDAVVVRDYLPGSYTALLSDNTGETGIALLELYEVAGEIPVDARLINLSTRGFVGRNDSVMIGGFVIEGPVAMNLLIRGVGPELANFNVPGTLSDPHLTLYSGNTILDENDDWGSEQGAEKAAAFATVGAFPLPENSRDSAMLVSLESGAYTVIMKGASGGTGIALFEIYVLE